MYGIIYLCLHLFLESECDHCVCTRQGISCIFSAFAGMAAGRLASAGGQFKLLLAAAMSLAIITATVALAVQDTPDVVGSNKPRNTVTKINTKMKSKRVAKKSHGGLLTVLG